MKIDGYTEIKEDDKMINLIEYAVCKLRLRGGGNPKFSGHFFTFISGKCIYCNKKINEIAMEVWRHYNETNRKDKE